MIKYRVQPETYRRGYCPALYDDYKAACDYCMMMSDITGFAWIVVVQCL